jgi:hypothetical protein
MDGLETGCDLLGGTDRHSLRRQHSRCPVSFGKECTQIFVVKRIVATTTFCPLLYAFVFPCQCSYPISIIQRVPLTFTRVACQWNVRSRNGMAWRMTDGRLIRLSCCPRFPRFPHEFTVALTHHGMTPRRPLTLTMSPRQTLCRGGLLTLLIRPGFFFL